MDKLQLIVTAPAFISLLVLASVILFSQFEFCNFAKNITIELVPVVGASGPESFVFDSTGQGPYTGVSDGRILKWQEGKHTWIDFAVTSPRRDACEGAKDHEKMEHVCGRPLGLSFNQSNGDLYIADAYMGLLKVGPGGGLATTVVTCVEGSPLRFTNGLDIDQLTGHVYFTDSSSVYQRRFHVVMSKDKLNFRNHIAVVASGDRTGRLMKYDARSNQVTVLISNLSFPNGIAISADGNFLLLVETTPCRVLRYWIRTRKAGRMEVFANSLPGFPDNIRSRPGGGYWVGIHSKRGKLLEWILSNRYIRSALLKYVPLDMLVGIQNFLARHGRRGMAVRMSESGEVFDTFEDKEGNKLRSISEVVEKDGELWIGSVNLPFAGRYKL